MQKWTSGEHELTEREPDPDKRTDKRSAEAGRKRKDEGQEGGKTGQGHQAC